MAFDSTNWSFDFESEQETAEELRLGQKSFPRPPAEREIEMRHTYSLSLKSQVYGDGTLPSDKKRNWLKNFGNARVSGYY